MSSGHAREQSRCRFFFFSSFFSFLCPLMKKEKHLLQWQNEGFLSFFLRYSHHEFREAAALRKKNQFFLSTIGFFFFFKGPLPSSPLHLTRLVEAHGFPVFLSIWDLGGLSLPLTHSLTHPHTFLPPFVVCLHSYPSSDRGGGV